MKKRILSLVLILAMVLLCVPIVAMAEERIFIDVSQSHWAYEVINELTNEGVIDGMGDGTFDPEGLVTREQFMKLLVCALDCDTENSCEAELSDVSDANWSAPYINAGIERGIYDIDEAGDYFNPAGELKRGISAEWIVDGLGVTAEADNVFSDVSNYGKQSEAIASAAKIGIVAGYEDNTFHAENTITRAEAAALIKRVMDYRADLYGVRDDTENAIELQDDVAIAESSKLVNVPTSVDAKNKTITFSKADETLTDLMEGDILFIPPCDNMPNGFVGKVVYVNGSKSNTKIKFEEPELAEVVQSVDISTYVSAGLDNYANDGELTAVSAVKGVSSKENGMEFDGSASAYMTPDITWHGVKIHAGADADEKAMVHFETESYKEKSGLYAAVDMNMEAKIDIQLETDNFDITKFDASADLITDVSAVGGYNNSASKEYTYDLPTCTIPLSGIFNVNIYSKLVVKADGSLNIEATADFDNNMGAKFTIDDGFTTHNTTNANAEITVDAEGSLKIGPKEELKLTFCGIDVMGKKFFGGISLIEADAEFGIGATGKTLIDKKASLSDDKISFGDDGELKHLCYFCIEGDIIRYFDGNIGVGEDVQNLINKICDKELSYEFADSEDKISDWHLSTGEGYTLEFEMQKCPHYEVIKKANNDNAEISHGDENTPNNQINFETDIEIGDYIQIGTYYGEPILWRCVDIDENGPLILSDKIICLKAFDASGDNTVGSHERHEKRPGYGSNYWADSNIRSWLNSQLESGEVTWLCGNPPDQNHVRDGCNDYDNEAGFLKNFSDEEIDIIQTVTQNSIVAHPDADYGIYDIGSELHIYNDSIESIVQNYEEAYAEFVTDRMFLLDVKQENAVYKNSDVLGDGYYIGQPTASCVINSEYKNAEFKIGQNWYYWLRTPHTYDTFFEDSNVRYVSPNGRVNSNDGDGDAFCGNIGIRPAFYLAYDAQFNYGKGRLDDPYRFNKDTSKSLPEGVMEYNGHRYKIFHDTFTWIEAKKFCENMGGHLATITSEAENDFIYHLLQAQDINNAYLGGTDCIEEGDWQWITNELWNYNNWASGEPNNQSNNEHYLMFYDKTGNQWNDGDGEVEYFVCEWDTIEN